MGTRLQYKKLLERRLMNLIVHLSPQYKGNTMNSFTNQEITRHIIHSFFQVIGLRESNARLVKKLGEVNTGFLRPI